MQELPAISEEEIESLNVYGARVHNLKNIDVQIPRNKLVVITGISGSGKSSLAFDTIYAEGQRRYMESFSAYARQFIGSMERPDVEKITGLSPVISIEQKTTNKNPRSTVGTITEIYDFMRLLYARTGEAYSHATGKKMVRFTEQQIVQHIFKHFKDQKIVLLAPMVKGRKGHYRELFEQLRKQRYLKVRIDGEIVDIEPKMQVDRYKIHDIEVVIDRMAVEPKFASRLTSSLETAIQFGKGLVMVLEHETGKVHSFSKLLMDPESGVSYDEPSPNSFSFNSPYGACPGCKGLGFIHDSDMKLVIPDENLSINEKGIRPFGEVRDNYTFKKIRALSQKYDFTFATPIKDIPKEALEILLYGTNGQSIPVNIQFGKDRWYDMEFEGVVNTVTRCYAEKEISEKIRRWAETFMIKKNCPTCNGQRLNQASLHFKIVGKNIADLCEMDIEELQNWFTNIEEDLTVRQKTIAKDILKEIRARLGFLLDVGLDYLTLNRPSRSLSGGESQRIRLATQIGSKLVGITYILDEPSIGLHQRDNQRLIEALKELCETGNTVLVVEHDKDIMLAADYVIDIGPGAGKHGGEIVAAAPPKEFLQKGTLTTQYLKGTKKIEIPAERRKGNGKYLILKGAKGNNLRNLDFEFPLGMFLCVTG
ncbi:MAG: excinuclease ABC subunit UvrA, partial [Chitinophagales bacterium]